MRHRIVVNVERGEELFCHVERFVILSGVEASLAASPRIFTMGDKRNVSIHSTNAQDKLPLDMTA